MVLSLYSRAGAAPRGRPFFHARERVGTGTRPYGVFIAIERDAIYPPYLSEHSMSNKEYPISKEGSRFAQLFWKGQGQTSK